MKKSVMLAELERVKDVSAGLTAVQMRRVEALKKGLSFSVIATSEEVTPGTVSNSISAAITKMRRVSAGLLPDARLKGEIVVDGDLNIQVRRP